MLASVTLGITLRRTCILIQEYKFENIDGGFFWTVKTVKSHGDEFVKVK